MKPPSIRYENYKLLTPVELPQENNRSLLTIVIRKSDATGRTAKISVSELETTIPRTGI